MNRTKPTIKSGTRQWGTPDWRKPELYPKPDGLSLSEWRWEFLRRDPQYRQDWDNFRKLDHPFKLALVEDPTEEGFDLPKYPDEFPDRHKDVWYILQEYKLARLPNPSIAKPRHIRFYPVPNHGALIWFDLEGSLKDELDYARNLLERHQRAILKKLRRYKLPDKAEWPTYLRILDALNNNVSHETIGYEILGVSRKIHGPETAINNAASKIRTAISVWKKLPVEPMAPGVGMPLTIEKDFDDIVPPGSFPRIVLPRL